jgi:hypothetical protein
MLYTIFSKCINILAPKIANCDIFNEYIIDVCKNYEFMNDRDVIHALKHNDIAELDNLIRSFYGNNINDIAKQCSEPTYITDPTGITSMHYMPYMALTIFSIVFIKNIILSLYNI